MVLPLLLQAGPALAADCLLTGLCGLSVPDRPVPPGVFFLAIGLVAVGVRGLRLRRA